MLSNPVMPKAGIVYILELDQVGDTIYYYGPNGYKTTDRTKAKRFKSIWNLAAVRDRLSYEDMIVHEVSLRDLKAEEDAAKDMSTKDLFDQHYQEQESKREQSIWRFRE